MHADEKKPRPKGTVAVAIQELRKTANSGNESEGDDTKTANPSAVCETSNSGNESEGDDTKSTSKDSGKFSRDKGGAAEGV